MVISFSDSYIIIPRSLRIDGWLDVKLNVEDFVDTPFCFLYKGKYISIQMLHKSRKFLLFTITENLFNKRLILFRYENL
jgi:hypothetical protein